MNLQKKYKIMKRIKIILDNEIDLIPYFKRQKKVKYFECKILCFKIITENII